MSDLTHVLHFNQSCVKAASLTKIYGLLDFYTNIAGVRFLRYESWKIPRIIESYFPLLLFIAKVIQYISKCCL